VASAATPGSTSPQPGRARLRAGKRRSQAVEPLWTLIPSNKAILPILWQLFPGHPYLLNCGFELTEDLESRGHVAKPIAGRCGHNVTIYAAGSDAAGSYAAGSDAAGSDALAETAGRFDGQDMIFQEYFPLPSIDDDHVQVCTFSVVGGYAGSCVRVDPSLVITTNSDLIALRVIEDDDLH